MNRSVKLPGALGLLVVALQACGVSVAAQDVVLVDALRKTDCARLDVNYEGGRYIASGCGKRLVYACDRPAGTGMTKPSAIANAGCKEEQESPPNHTGTFTGPDSGTRL